jgi:hypothetical protein
MKVGGDGKAVLYKQMSGQEGKLWPCKADSDHFGECAAGRCWLQAAPMQVWALNALRVWGRWPASKALIFKIGSKMDRVL